jgi:hypothetical protein
MKIIEDYKKTTINIHEQPKQSLLMEMCQNATDVPRIRNSSAEAERSRGVGEVTAAESTLCLT